MKKPILRTFILLLLSQGLFAADSNWSVQCDDTSQLQIHYHNIPVVKHVQFRAVLPNRDLAYQMQAIASQKQN